MEQACIFCKIIAGEIPSNFEYQDEKCLAFYDIHPRANTHILIIPKLHIPKVSDLKDDQADLIAHLILVAKKIAKQKNIEDYKLQFNVGKLAGQELFHIHLHLMSAQ